jgi:tripartite-type tricarboxylate transporter receptor subunit TctC
MLGHRAPDAFELRAFALLVAAAAMLGSPAGPAAAQTGTTKVIYPFAAGGSGDVLTRIVTDQIAAALGTTAIVENRTGAAGRIAAKAVAAAPPDGLTLLLASSPMMVIYPHSYAALDYDPVKDFAPIASAAAFDIALAVGPQMATKVKTVAELVAFVKANPAQGSYGSPGAGGLGHFGAVMFANSAKLELRHVTYRGSGAVLTDLVAGQLPMAVLPLGDVTEQHKAGRLRALASAGPGRSSFLPDVPTFKELGFDFEGQGWYGLYAPARTPPELIARLNKAVVEGLTKPDVKERIAKLSLETIPSTPAGLAARQKADLERWGPVVKASGFKPEQ